MFIKLFEYLVSNSCNWIVTTKGVLLPVSDGNLDNIDVAEITPLLPDTFRCSELPKQFRDDPQGSLFIGLKPVVDVVKATDKAVAKLESLLPSDETPS